MARIPDYDKMRQDLALYESEQIDRKDLSEILLYGACGYDQCEDEEVLSLYVDCFGATKIPKIEMGESNGKR